MNAGGEAAEQVVRMSLEGVEVAARITGYGAKNLAVLIAAVLKEEQKTAGKARLTNMIKSGQELKVFTVQQKDLKKFAKEAKRYGVLYSILKEKNNDDPNAAIDVIARANDAPKISRIIEKFNLNSVDKASVVKDMEADLNPSLAKTDRSPQSLQSSEKEKGYRFTKQEKKPSVRERIALYREEIRKKNESTPRRNVIRRPAKRLRDVKER